VLLQTSICNAEKRSHRPFVQEDIVKENFNISVGKIKKYFKADYLLDLLRYLSTSYWLGRVIDSL
jgi:hypothetical protein